MLGYLLKRGFQTIVVIFITITLVFFITRLSGDPTHLYMPEDSTIEQVEEFRAKMGFDQPLYVQYWDFLTGALRADFGESLNSNIDAIQLVLSKIPATLQLAATSLFFALIIAIPFGMISAYKQDTIYDRLGMGVTLVGQAAPGFWLGLLLMYLFSITFNIFPTSGGGSLLHLVLPAVTLATHSAARFARFTRSSMLDILRKDYIRTAKSTGAPTIKILSYYSLKNVLIPIITITALDLGVLMGGAVVIESVFAWPGLGQLLLQSLMTRDFPVVTAAVFFIAISISVINFIADVLYGYVNPQVRVK